MQVRTVGIIGYGSFGQFTHTLVKRFAPGVAVRVFSSKKKPDGKAFFSLEAACASDVVMLSVPIHAFESMLKKVLPLTKPETVLVDVCTVKMHTSALLARYAKGRRYISSHPMFGPESYEKSKKDVSGFRIVITNHTLKSSEYTHAMSYLRSCGFQIIETTPKKHDKHLAETLFLTHFIGQTITRGGFTRTDIDTVSFKFLMDAVESVKNDTALFQDVFRFDPFCKETLAKLERAELKTRALLRGAVGKARGILKP